jgi:hypothetical protein
MEPPVHPETEEIEENTENSTGMEDLPVSNSDAPAPGEPASAPSGNEDAAEEGTENPGIGSFAGFVAEFGIDPTLFAQDGEETKEKPPDPAVQERINKYRKFKKVDGASYRRVNQFLRKHTHITAREWAIARLCGDFSTRSGAEMTFIGEHLPELVPFMTDTYSPQAVNQARNSFKRKVRKAGATFFYGALCGFFTADELDDILFEASEVARFLLEVEGTSIDIDDEIDIEDRITEVMRSVAEAASMIRQPKDEETEGEEHS